MENKLPVVGKKYRDKIHHIVFKVDNIIDGKLYYTMDGRKLIANMPILIEHWNYFEELPEDKAETKLNCGLCGGNGKLTSLTIPPAEVDCYKCNTKPCEVEIKPETQSHISELSPEVKKAMEELKKILIKESDSMFFTVHQSEHTTEVLRLTCHAFSDKAKTLLNALDKQFKVNETSESVDIKEEEVNKISCGYNPLSDSKMIYLREEWGKNGEGFGAVWGKNGEGFGAVLGKDMVGNLENKEEPNEKSEFELLMAGAEKIDKVDADIKKQTVDEFFSDYEKLKERVKKLEEK